jgi:hypothetical protein
MASVSDTIEKALLLKISKLGMVISYDAGGWVKRKTAASLPPLLLELTK